MSTNGELFWNIPDVGTMLKTDCTTVSPSFEIDSLLCILDWGQSKSETLFLCLGPCENLNPSALRNCRNAYLPVAILPTEPSLLA